MTKNFFMYLVLFLLLGSTTAGCWGCFGGSDDEEQTQIAEEENNRGEENNDDPQVPDNLGDAINEAQNAIQDALGNTGEGTVVKEAVDFRDLKDELPERIDNLNRINSEGERQSVMGMSFSQATADYEDGNRRLELSISDIGTLSGLARMGFAAWLQTEVDRESDRGFERTRRFRSGGKEYPSFEKFEGQGSEGNCEIQVWVAERFIVSVEGRNVEMEVCEEARDEVSYRKLERMKTIGTEEG